ncbi:hypothetical protein [uncultured Amnibacterium sp.]|uniref:PASTA domain-containing protein n=1 Tax=uncultured Amnibacterium sp. TaxID=1631851 RepID=UPI0035CB552F
MTTPGGQQPTSSPGSRDRIALWALILGLIAVLIAFIPFGAFVGWLPGIAAIVLAIVALVRRTSRRALAVIGLVVAVLGAPISGGVTAVAIGGAAVQAAGTPEQSADAAKVATTTETTTAPEAPAATAEATTSTADAADAKVAVPKVVGLAGNDARDRLEAAGFEVDWSQLVIIASNWKVTKQSAKKAATGSTITLTVKPKPKEASKAETLHAVFKVWGTGDPDVTYSTDSDNIEGKIGRRYVMKVSDDALYYAVTAQLQGSGDIRCSVTINGVTKKGHASGGYNICSAQLSSSPFSTGGWG